MAEQHAGFKHPPSPKKSRCDGEWRETNETVTKTENRRGVRAHEHPSKSPKWKYDHSFRLQLKEWRRVKVKEKPWQKCLAPNPISFCDNYNLQIYPAIQSIWKSRNISLALCCFSWGKTREETGILKGGRRPNEHFYETANIRWKMSAARSEGRVHFITGVTERHALPLRRPSAVSQLQ